MINLISQFNLSVIESHKKGIGVERQTLFLGGRLDSLADNLVDVLNSARDLLRLLLHRVDAVGDLIVDVLVVELPKGESEDLALSIFTVMPETEVRTTVIVFHREQSLVDNWVVDGILQK